AGSIGVLELAALIAWLLVRPDSPQEMYEAVKNAKTPDARTAAAKRYLDIYGKSNDPKAAEFTAKVKDIYWDARVRKREQVLLNRHQSKFRNTVEEKDDAGAYTKTMKALAEEDDGDVVRARALWTELVEDFQQNSNDDKALWGWIAAKRLKDLQQ